MIRGLFITGSDTSIGKTVVAAALMHRYRDELKLRYWKPIQTGIEQDNDTVVVRTLGHCVDDEIIKWLERREQRRRGKQPPSRCSAIDNPDYDESRQNEYPIGNLGTRYRCFSAEPFHGLPPG